MVPLDPRPPAAAARRPPARRRSVPRPRRRHRGDRCVAGRARLTRLGRLRAAGALAPPGAAPGRRTSLPATPVDSRSPTPRSTPCCASPCSATARSSRRSPPSARWPVWSGRAGVVCLWEPGVRRLRRAHDRVTHTGRRFSRRDLAELLTANGLTLERSTGAYSFLVPPAAAKTVLERGDTSSDLDRNGSGLGGVLPAVATGERAPVAPRQPAVRPVRRGRRLAVSVGFVRYGVINNLSRCDRRSASLLCEHDRGCYDRSRGATDSGGTLRGHHGWRGGSSFRDRSAPGVPLWPAVVLGTDLCLWRRRAVRLHRVLAVLPVALAVGSVAAVVLGGPPCS